MLLGKKIELLQVQFGRPALTNFTCLAANKIEYPNFDFSNYAASANKQRVKLASRLPEFWQDEIKVKLLAHPFDLAVKDSPDDYQMKLIELQAEMDTKRGYCEKIVWWTSTNSMFVERFPICPAMEKMIPSLLAPTAVNNSFKNDSHQGQLSTSADWWTFNNTAYGGYHGC